MRWQPSGPRVDRGCWRSGATGPICNRPAAPGRLGVCAEHLAEMRNWDDGPTPPPQSEATSAASQWLDRLSNELDDAIRRRRAAA